MTRTITITSGKGGAGKTSTSVNLALHLATLGYRTCLFDADLGLANVNVLLGLYPEYNLEDVILYHHNIEDIIIRDYKGIDIIPGSSGVERIANLEADQVEHLIESFSVLEGYDFLLFDTSAGVSKNVISFCLASSEVIVVITPELTSLTDAYALLKILCLNGFKGSVKIVVNQCKSTTMAKQAYTKFKETAKKYLSINVVPLGIIVQDPKVEEAVKEQQAFVLLYPESNAAKCIKSIAKCLMENHSQVLEASSMTSFWTRCLQLIKGPLNLTDPKKKKKGIEPKASTREAEKRPPSLAHETERKSVTGESEAPDYCQPERTAPLEKGISLLMNKLLDTVSSVSKELHLIRKTMENGGRNHLSVSGFVDKQQEAPQRESIPLDFDAFLKQRATEVRREDNE
jgi:flagellar biosynthesis protein FlhG